MKKLIPLLLLFLALNAKAQNVITYVNTVYNDSVITDTNTIDITYLKTNSLITANMANKMIEFKNMPMIRNISANKRGICQVIQVVWGSTTVNNLLLGDYTGINDNQSNLFDLYFSENKPKRKELIQRLRHELENGLNDLIDSVCVGITNNNIFAGTLLSFNESENWAILVNKNGWECRKVEFYTVCKATEEEILKYYN